MAGAFFRTPCEAEHLETHDLLRLDEYLVAVHKPARLLVHRSPIDRHLAASELPFAIGR